MTTWTAGAFVFSGRPDPSWVPAAQLGTRLDALWRALEPLPGPAPAAPALGYRGCFVDDGAGTRFSAYDGVVTRTAAGGGGAAQLRDDPTRAFERLVVDTLPDDDLRATIRALAGLQPR